MITFSKDPFFYGEMPAFSSNVNIKFELNNDAPLSQIIEQFENFLKGAGYSLKGELGFINVNDDDVDDSI
jgi:hypothetical protein